MKVKIVRLRFETKVHFGSGGLEKSQNIVYADTLFSSLFLEAMKLGVSDPLYSMFHEDRIRISDALPFIAKAFYVPRPFMPLTHGEENVGIKKKVKNLKYIPIGKLPQYLKGRMDAAEEEAYFHSRFGSFSLDEKVSMPNAEEENLLYAIKSFQYGADCGLYLCIQYNEEEDFKLLKKVLHSLSYSGLGGKISSGYGKFYSETVPDSETAAFKPYLSPSLSGFSCHMALSICLPGGEEMEKAVEGASFQVAKRGGFIRSDVNGGINRKKQTKYMFTSGSVFKNTFHGRIYDVSAGGAHPVYRYGRPLFMGVY